MVPAIPSEFFNVRALTKANIYFDGGVVSHTLYFPDQSRKTLGIIRPGTYHFSTDLAEKMEIVAGSCRVQLQGSTRWINHAQGASFEVPAKSGFDIEVTEGHCEYICSFIP